MLYRLLSDVRNYMENAMRDLFKFEQGNTGIVQLAKVTVPECGRNEKDDAPILLVEREGSNITLFVYADILSTLPTHEISLNGARLTLKAAANG